MALFAKRINMAVGDTKPDVVMHVTDEETGAIVDLTDADSVDFFLYDLDADALTLDGGAAAVLEASDGTVTKLWATDGSESVAVRGVGYFRIFWAASDEEPMTTTAVEINIKEPHKRMS